LVRDTDAADAFVEVGGRCDSAVDLNVFVNAVGVTECEARLRLELRYVEVDSVALAPMRSGRTVFGVKGTLPIDATGWAFS
jgi:hypothetical protein